MTLLGGWTRSRRTLASSLAVALLAGVPVGLAIAYEIAREHEGRLELRASDLGGACFVLALPVRPAAA